MSRDCDERGAAALLTLTVAVAATVLGLAVATVTTQALGAAARARAAADAAALAAAGASGLGPHPGSPRLAAQEAATRFGVELLSCCGDTAAVPPRVRVVVAARPHGLAGRLGNRWTAEARASLRPPRSREPSGLRANVPNSHHNGAAPGPRR
jgi:hypothetical protein